MYEQSTKHIAQQLRGLSENIVSQVKI